jgi:hypothetical protein
VGRGGSRCAVGPSRARAGRVAERTLDGGRSAQWSEANAAREAVGCIRCSQVARARRGAVARDGALGAAHWCKRWPRRGGACVWGDAIRPRYRAERTAAAAAADQRVLWKSRGAARGGRPSADVGRRKRAVGAPERRGEAATGGRGKARVSRGCGGQPERAVAIAGVVGGRATCRRAVPEHGARAAVEWSSMRLRGRSGGWALNGTAFARKPAFLRFSAAG